FFCFFLFFFFFFSSRRRHTRSDRDWSSDVCSSDLGVRGEGEADVLVSQRCREPRRLEPLLGDEPAIHLVHRGGEERGGQDLEIRSEERRVGKECRCRWWGEK